VFLLTKKDPQVEILPARNLTQKKPTIKVRKLYTSQKLSILIKQCHAVWYKFTDASEEYIASSFRVQE
jgi:hypothetical protein